MGREFEQTFFQRKTDDKYTHEKNEVIEKEIRFVVTRGGTQGKGKLEEGSQKVQTST